MNTALFLRCRGVIQTLTLWLGLGALMVQALAPLCAPGFMGAVGQGTASIVICTAHGFETVQIGADGMPLPHQPAHNFSDCCTACHAAGGFTVASPILVAASSSIAYEDAWFEPAPVVRPRFYSSYVTRGPPHLS